MSKITFRADDDLVERVERLDTSKSEAMREALRSYLEQGDESERGSAEALDRDLDSLVASRVDAVLADRLDRQAPARERERDVQVTITVESGGAVETEQSDGDVVVREDDGRDAGGERDAAAPERDDGDGDVDRDGDGGGRGETERRCGRCGESVADGHVYCPNCGEKTSRRLFCECGDELRSDWAYCPGCGRRTPSADVLDG